MTNPKTSPVAESVVERAEQWLRACSDWLLSNDLDMQMPDGILDTDPLDIADDLAAMPRPIEDDTPTDAGGVTIQQFQQSPVVADYGEHLLVAHASKDGKMVGIDHPCDAAWADVITALIALRDRINERIAEQDGCPYKPKDTPTDAGEGVEPVAVIGTNWQLLWADQQTLTGIVDRTGIKIGSLLYAHPTPTDTGLVGELVEALDEIEQNIRCAAGCDDDLSEDQIDSFIMSWGGSPMAVGYQRVRTALSKAKDTPHG